MVKRLSVALAFALLAVVPGPAHAAVDASLTAGPLMNGFAGAFSPTTDCRTTTGIVVTFEAEFVQGTGILDLTSSCGNFHVIFTPGECFAFESPQKGVLCSFRTPDGGGSVRTFSRDSTMRLIGGGVSFTSSGTGWGFVGTATGVN